jgi:hypothetical protein
MDTTLNFDITNPTPFIKKYINNNYNTINTLADSLLSDNIHSDLNHIWHKTSPLTQKLAYELTYYRLENNDTQYYLSFYN